MKQILQRLLLTKRPLAKLIERVCELLVEYRLTLLVHADFKRCFVDFIDWIEEDVTLAGALLVADALDIADKDAVAGFV